MSPGCLASPFICCSWWSVESVDAHKLQIATACAELPHVTSQAIWCKKIQPESTRSLGTIVKSVIWILCIWSCRFKNLLNRLERYMRL